MTPEEQQMLGDLANKIAQTPPPQRDPQAEEFIRTRIGSRPDALYLMTQTVLIQNMALEHAKQQIQELQQRPSAVPGAAQPSGFLGGVAPAAPRGSGGWGSPQPSYPATPSAPPPPAPAPSAPASGGGSSFLRSAATTAAGVAAGALAFEGIRALFGGIEHLAGFGGGQPTGGSGFLGGGGVPSETIINNYYENPEPRASDDTGDDSDDSGDDTDSSDDTDDSSNDDSSDDNLV